MGQRDLDSPALGYVVATHQSLQSRTERTVWTYYCSPGGRRAARNRRLLLEKDWGTGRYRSSTICRGRIRTFACASRVDVMRMGHAMARPSVGAIFSPARLNLTKPHGPVLFAHSDISGFSVFEEAQYRGVSAADEVLRRLR